jgi:hypothetical protein
MIDYFIISRALAHYRNKGYREIDVPWLVSDSADDVTRPDFAAPVEVDGLLRLPGSGEQGFIDLMLRKELPPGRYVTTTPCFRREAQYTDLVRPWFLKVELIAVGKRATESLVADAKEFLSQYLPVREKVTPDGIDLESETGVELGSYGVRETDFALWTYGTGVAEPRFSTVLDHLRQAGS